MGTRGDPKAMMLSYQARHRALALEKQAGARRQALLARRLALGPEASRTSSAGETGQEEGEEASSAMLEPERPRPSTSGRSAKTSRETYSQQLMQPEWMLEVPEDLATQWYVAARPEGVRCLVISSRGSTIARLRSGITHARFASALPGGGPGAAQGEDAYCILDCVHHVADDTYYVMDMMCWRGCSLYHCTADFRLFWVVSKLAEVAAEARGGSAGRAAPRFAAAAYSAATPAGLREAYTGSVPFVRDGLVFLHREAHYVPGASPLCMLWKDEASSRYAIDTDAAGVPLPNQRMVLVHLIDGSVATGDAEPCALGRMPMDAEGRTPAPGALSRFELGAGGFVLRDGRPLGADLRYLGPAGGRRGRADTLSRVLFQHLARTAPLRFATLETAAAAVIGAEGSAMEASSVKEEMDAEEEETPSSSMQQE